MTKPRREIPLGAGQEPTLEHEKTLPNRTPAELRAGVCGAEKTLWHIGVFRCELVKGHGTSHRATTPGFFCWSQEVGE